MMPDLKQFEFEGNGVRMMTRDAEPWFVLADVCRVLEISNVGNAAARLDEDEKGNIRNTDVTSAGGNPFITIINESGLYSLILTSRKEAAKRFKKWVTSEVLPTLRRTGAYVMTSDDEDLPSLADGKVFGCRVSKVNAAARLISVANQIYGPEAARALWEAEPGLPSLMRHTVGELTGSAADDPLGCFRHLIRAAAGNGRTVGDVLTLGLRDAVAAKALKAYGIAVGPAEAPGYVAFANRNGFLARLYAETPWIGNWRLALMGLPGARGSKGMIGFDGGTSRAVIVPKAEVLSLINPAAGMN